MYIVFIKPAVAIEIEVVDVNSLSIETADLRDHFSLFSSSLLTQV